MTAYQELIYSGRITFPISRGIDINMMPFIIGDQHSIPTEYRHYWSLVDACKIEDNLTGKIGYISIKESLVPPGESHRRSGIHTEGWGGGESIYLRTTWGAGDVAHKLGIYMASNVPNSCRIWNTQIDSPNIGGSLEQMRDILESVPHQMMRANFIYWLTDKTPHESVPLFEQVFRQWFRVVCGPVTIRYASKSTDNQLGIKVPDYCKIEP